MDKKVHGSDKSFDARMPISQNIHGRIVPIHEHLVAVYGESSPSFSTVKRWTREFQCSRKSIQDGNPSV